MAEGQGRSSGQQRKLLLLKKYLLDNTDDTHVVNANDIIKYIKLNDISVTRRTVYTDIELLQHDEDDIEIDYFEHIAL